MNLRIRSLARVFGPALLATTLVLPVEILAAPSAAFATVKVEKSDKKNKHKQRNPTKHDRGQQRRQQVQAQQRREARQRQAELQRQQYQRRIQLERQAEIRRQAEWRRQAELRRQAQVRRDNRNDDPRNRRYDGNSARYYRDGGRFRYDGRYYGPNDRFHIDGFVVDEGSHFSLFKDHQTGELFALVGNIGDIQQGDHMRLQGRVVDGGVCDWRGTGFEVIQVKTLWSNNRHEHAPYDFQRDRISFEQYLDRHSSGW